MRLWLSSLLLCLCAITADAQQNLPTPSAGSFVVTTVPMRDGVRATADLPTSQHHKNVGGSDSAGLCVYTSAWHASLWSSVTEIYDFRNWMQKRPGGSYPEKFEKTLTDFCKERGIPVPGYVQHTGGDEEFLEMALKTGRMVCVTYCGVDGVNRYGNEVIGHMVNLVHLDKDRAAILDNNFPGSWLWMSRSDFLARWRGVQANGRPFLGRDGFGRAMPIGGGWAIVFLAPPPAPYAETPPVQLGRDCGCSKCDCDFGQCPNCTKTAVATSCICGENCDCEKNGRKCPSQCRVLIGQNCPNGRCPLPQPQPTLPMLVDNGAGQWVGSDGKEWGYWKGGKRIAAVFADGHCEATNEYGIANGVPIEPPAPLPLGVAKKPSEVVPAAAVAHGDFPPNGVEPSRLTSDKRWWCNGEPCSKEEAHAALALTDDSGRWNLAVVGDPGFQRKVLLDLNNLSIDVRAKLHVQSYTGDSWQAAQFKLGQGLTLRKPAIGRVGADVGTIPVGDYSAVKLGELLTSPGSPNPKPTPAPTPKPKEPDAKPAPASDPASEPKPAGVSPLLLILAAFGFWFFFIRK